MRVAEGAEMRCRGMLKDSQTNEGKTRAGCADAWRYSKQQQATEMGAESKQAEEGCEQRLAALTATSESSVRDARSWLFPRRL